MKYLIFLVFGIASYQVSAQCTGYAMTITVSHPTCYQFSDGSVSAFTTGGNGGENWVITDSNGTPVNVGGGTANILGGGWYYITVVDMMGCTLTDSVQLIDPLQMTVDSTITDALCSYDSTGSIVIDSLHNPTGNPNFVNYFWSPNPNNVGPSSDSTGQVPAGVYSLQVNDENGCSAQFDFTVGAPPLLYFHTFGGDDCVNGNDGVVYMAATGGVPDYDYDWVRLSDFVLGQGFTTWGGQNADCFEGTATDNNGCTVTDTICIGCLGIAELNFSFDLYPNPASNHLFIKYENSELIDVEIWSLDGRIIFSDTKVNSNQLISIEGISAGTYLLLARAEGLLGQKTIVIE